MSKAPELSAFDELQPCEGLDPSRRVFVSRHPGAPIILMHELPAIGPELMRFADCLVQNGFKVYLPELLQGFDRPGGSLNLRAMRDVCVRREFKALMGGDQTRPIVAWIRSLARCASERNENKSVGIVGLCFSGGFALAAATEGVIAGAVACEASLPFHLLPIGDKSNIDISRSDFATLRARVEAGEVALRAYKFEGDPLSPCERMLRLGREFGALDPPEGFCGRCIADSNANPNHRVSQKAHSVVTHHLIDKPGEVTRAARDEIIAFFKWRLSGGPHPAFEVNGLRDCAKDGCARGKH